VKKSKSIRETEFVEHLWLANWRIIPREGHHADKLSDLLTEINSLESISSAWGVLRSRGGWSLWSFPEPDEQVANELRGLRVELADLVAKRDALLAEDGLIWRHGAVLDTACEECLDDLCEDVLGDDRVSDHK
jgi:hypothetical protein